MYSVGSLERLINQLTRLPGIGERSARRLAFHILKQPKNETLRLIEAIRAVKDKVKRCSICNNFSEEDPCAICKDEGRDKSVICVVEEPQDVFLFEKIREYRGLYHVLGGAISPLKGVNPEDLNIESLLERVKEGKVKEIILATDPDTEGEATAIYLFKLLSPFKVKVSRLAHGLPAGGDLEFADEITLTHALRGRKDMEESWDV